MLNLAGTTAQVDRLCKQLGQQFSVVRASSTIGKVYGVVGTSETTDSTASGVSNLTVESKTIYIPAQKRWAPQPGDEFVANKITYFVSSVEAYQPGKTAIAYKVMVE